MSFPTSIPLDSPMASRPGRRSRLNDGCCLSILLLIWTGCQSAPKQLTSQQQRIATELESISPWNDPLPASTPIIDVHTHTFNARYLPLEGILLGKRDAYSPVTTLISDETAVIVARALIEQTELGAVGDQPGIARKEGLATLRHSGPHGLITEIFLDLIDLGLKEGAWNPEKSPREQMAAISRVALKMNATQRVAIHAAAHMMGMEDGTSGDAEGPGTISGVEAAVRFLWMLTQSDARMITLFREMYQDTPRKGEITLVSHMMDLAPVYDQIPDGHTLLDFPTQQVRRMEQFQDAGSSNLIYFVAYCPYRVPNSTPSGGLEVVRDAILHHHARGVKFYPPSGYRPADNQVRPRPYTLFTSAPGRQWERRYGALGPDKDKALNAEVNQLLEWCIEQDIPVFVHSGYGQFEARKGYGEYHSNPEFWRRFLERHSTPGKPCTLRLCLGHAGGEDFWFGTGEHAAWGQCVYDLCTQYPNVYCEITTSEKFVIPESRACLVEHLSRLFDESARNARPSDPVHPTYPFARKLMYGTDWYLPNRGEPGAVLLSTQTAFLYSCLRNAYADYFSGNAGRYLKMEPTGANP